MTDLVSTFPGQCRLQVDSTTQISLQRYQGAYINLIVSGVIIARLIPASGPTLSNSGLSSSTLYYLYAFDSAGTLTLVASTTGHAVDSTFGIEVKSDDNTRTLVGMVYVNASGQFVDSTAARHLANWFNRSDHDLVGTFSADRTTTSTSFVEVNTEIEISLLAWADEAVEFGIDGTTSNSSGGNDVTTGLGIDSTSVSTQSSAITLGANARGPIGLYVAKRLSEGRHLITLLGAVSAGTGTWATADAINIGTTKTRLWAKTRI